MACSMDRDEEDCLLGHRVHKIVTRVGSKKGHTCTEATVGLLVSRQETVRKLREERSKK